MVRPNSIARRYIGDRELYTGNIIRLSTYFHKSDHIAEAETTGIGLSMGLCNQSICLVLGCGVVLVELRCVMSKLLAYVDSR